MEIHFSHILTIFQGFQGFVATLSLEKFDKLTSPRLHIRVK